MGALKGFIGPLWTKFLVKIGAQAPAKVATQTAAEKEVVKWFGKEGGEEYIKNRAADQGIKSGSGVGGPIVSVLISVGIALAFPGVGLAGQVVMGVIAEKGGEAAVGVVLNSSAETKPAPPSDGEGAEVTGMVPGDDGSTVQQPNDPVDVQPSEPNSEPAPVGGTGTTPHEGSSTTTNNTTTSENSTSTHEEPHEEPPAFEDPHDSDD